MVFSGIVQDIGRVKSVEKKAQLKAWDGSVGEGFVLEIKSEKSTLILQLQLHVALKPHFESYQCLY